MSLFNLIIHPVKYTENFSRLIFITVDYNRLLSITIIDYHH